MNLPTAERGSRLHQAVQSIHLWMAVGTLGSVGMVLVGTSLGSVIRPGNPRWWFQVAEGPATVARLGFYASVGAAHRGMDRGRVPRPSRRPDRGPVVGHPGPVGPSPAARAAPVQPRHLQLHRPGPAGLARVQSLLGGADGPRQSPAPGLHRRGMAEHGLPLRSAVRGREPGRSCRGRRVAGGPGPGVPGPGARRRGPDHGLAPPRWPGASAPTPAWPCGSVR